MRGMTGNVAESSLHQESAAFASLGKLAARPSIREAAAIIGRNRSGAARSGIARCGKNFARLLRRGYQKNGSRLTRKYMAGLQAVKLKACGAVRRGRSKVAELRGSVLGEGAKWPSAYGVRCAR